MYYIVLLSVVAFASAQYDYRVQNPAGIAFPIVGSAQLSEPIAPVVNTEYNKEFYTYSAPEVDLHDTDDHGRAADSIKKNLRVVFIKGPENTALENAVVHLAKQASEDRTAIYVLNKQADVAGLAQHLDHLRSNNPLKPEVHFIKYRTNTDADNAVRTIQSQYDSLPGQSRTHNAGPVPVLNFASKSSRVARPTATATAVPSLAPIVPVVVPISASVTAVPLAYLPSNRRHKK